MTNETKTKANPTVTCVEARADCRMAEFLLVGGDITPDWVEFSGARQAECRCTVYWCNDGRRESLASYGGTVWPSAWPHLFDITPLSVHGQSTYLTPEGERLFRAAIAKARGEETA